MPQSFPQRRPLLFVGLLLFLMFGAFVIGFGFTTIGHWPMIVVGMIGETLLGLVTVYLLSRLGWWHEAGFRFPQSSSALWYLVVPCLFLIANANAVFASSANPGLGTFLLFIVVAIGGGFVEEAYFRGLLLRTLLVRGAWQAAIISSIVFGCLHLVTLGEGQNPSATLLQVAWTIALGFLFAAVALRTQTILPLIAIHGSMDFVGFLERVRDSRQGGSIGAA